ncbi:MAG: hypothetical protein C0500_12180 [Sphingobium sp.]|nr:hypothetical protein [Sphingobium sp.]
MDRSRGRGRRWTDWLPFGLIVMLLLAAAIGGGAAFADAPLVVIVRVAALIVIAVALVLMPGALWRRPTVPILLFAALAALIALQLVPLPPAIWTGLPGRSLIAEVATQVGFAQPWRPLTLTPMATWNSLIACMVPLAAAIATVWLGPRRRLPLLVALIALGLGSAMLGMLQFVDASGGRFYLYQPADPGSAVGLFSNRNHQAAVLVCLLPLFAALAAELEAWRADLGWLASIGATILGLAVVPLLLVTGSRSGLLLLPLGGVLAVAVGWPVLRRRLRVRAAQMVVAAGAVIGASLTAWFVHLNRAQSLARLFATDVQAEQRVELVAPLWQMAMSYFPFGSGFGSFAAVYRIIEPDSQLNRTWLNHAHNDALELLSDGGLVAVLLAGAALIWWGMRAVALWRQPATAEGVTLGRAGTAVSLIILLASLSDYPLRTPLVALIFAIVTCWIAVPSSRQSVPRQE